MKIAIKCQQKDWHRCFTAVIEVDEKFGAVLNQEFIEEHLTRAIGTALCDLRNPLLAILMDHVNKGVLDLKDQIVNGFALSLEHYDSLTCSKEKKEETK